MDLSNLPPYHGGALGDVWFRGLAKPDHFLAAMREDFFLLVVGCMMKYIHLEKVENGLTYKARVVKAFNHGVDGVAAVCGNPFKDVYALAEKRLKPRIFIFGIQKNEKGELEPNFMHSLRHVHSWDIRTMEFMTKDIIIVLTGFPTFNIVLIRWTTNEQIMTSLSTEPNSYSRLLVSPINPCIWMEHGTDYIYVYDMPALNRSDVLRTKVNLPSRKLQFDSADPLMGRLEAIIIVSACWTTTGDFFVLDDQNGIHQYLPEGKVLQWMCSLTETFMGLEVSKMVPYGEGLAAITKDGWFLSYGEIVLGGTLEVLTAFKLSSNVIRYIHLRENPESFFAITESKGLVEGVSHGVLMDSFSIADLMFVDIKCCCFIEPESDYMAIATKFGKVVVLECDSGEPISKWKLPFKVVGIASHPALPFLFCGTTYGCVNVLDIRNLKLPKLINRRFLTREPQPSIERFGFVSQGRYVVSADIVNSRIFVQYGYPFMSFDFIDSAKLPAKISHLVTPGCGKDDNRFQVYMSGKSESDSGVVAFIVNFSIRNERLMIIASQTVDQPVTTLTMCPASMKKYLYAYYPLKKGLGVVPFCDDNEWLNLQEPETYVEHQMKHDINHMVFHATKLYTFGADGFIQVHEAPTFPRKKKLAMILNTIEKTQTHCFSDHGIREGIVSMDGSQVIAIGHDGTFCRVRFFPKPSEPDWLVLGYDRPKLYDYQVGSYLLDQEMYREGEEFIDRIADIKLKINVEDPVKFYDPAEDTSQEEDEVPLQTPKAEEDGEKLKYGPKKSWHANVTRRKKNPKPTRKDEPLDTYSGDKSSPHLETTTVDEDTTRVDDVSLSMDSSKDKQQESGKSVRLIEGGAEETDAEAEESEGEGEDEGKETKPEAEHGDAATSKKSEIAETLLRTTDADVVMSPVVDLETKSVTEAVPTVDSEVFPEPRIEEESNVVQKFLSKVQDTTVAPEKKTALRSELLAKKTNIKNLPVGMKGKKALKDVLAERLRKKQMAEDKAAPEDEVKKKKVTLVGDEEEVEEEEEEEKEEDGTEIKVGRFSMLLSEATTAKDVVTAFMMGRQAGPSETSASASQKKKIKRFLGGKASKMLAGISRASIKKRRQPPTLSQQARSRPTHSKIMKIIMDDSTLDKQSHGHHIISKKKGKKPGHHHGVSKSATTSAYTKRPEEMSDASKALLMTITESDTVNLEMSVLNDPAIQMQSETTPKSYEGSDVDDVVTVDYWIRRKEYTEAEYFAQYERTLLFRWHMPKADGLRFEFQNFMYLLEELIIFNRQREEAHQVDMKEFNFDEDREARLKERCEKLKKLVQIQMAVRNRLRIAKIEAMKLMLWDQFETKGMMIMGFRNKLEVTNYPLLPESEYYDGVIDEAINWRRLEQRLEIEEEALAQAAKEHALRVLNHEMHYMPTGKKRLYMKGIMAIDPTARFDDYEASDSDESDNEFFAEVFGELGLQIPDDIKESEAISGADTASKEAKSKLVAGAMSAFMGTTKAASKFMRKKKLRETAMVKRKSEMGYVEKLKKMLMEEQEQEDLALMALAAEESMSIPRPSEGATREQSKREFMVNIKPSKTYRRAKGLFGPGPVDSLPDTEIEVIMQPHNPDGLSDSQKQLDQIGGDAERKSKSQVDGSETQVAPTKTKLKMVVRQRKKLKFTRIPDVVIPDEEDVSGGEDEILIEAANQKFEAMDDEYKERFDTINNIFYGSSMSELIDMYQFKPSILRYSQFELGSRHELWTHHYIIMSEIYQLKKFFNRQFELLRNAKTHSLKKMEEKNERIREIYYYLKLNLEIDNEKWLAQEDPSQIFTVLPEEIPVEKYLTAEQRLLEEQRRLEELARQKTRMAEFRKKALFIMMDNRLEVKREEILINDIPKPPFMLEKDPIEYSIEEYLQSLQYAAAVEAIEISRAELIKELEEELGSLYRANAMEINTIDLRVTELSQMKFQFHHNFFMEETRILRAIRQLRIMEDIEVEEKRIAKIIVDLQTSMKTSHNLEAQLENKRLACEEEIAKIVEQEKDLEWNFRKDLGDVGRYFEFLYKNYRKKPKLSLKGMNRIEVYETMVRALRSDNIRNFAKDNGETGRAVVMAIYDMEDPMQMPKNCPRLYWDKFNKLRRERLVCEYEIKAIMGEMDRLSDVIAECEQKANEATETIAAVLGVLSHKNDLRNYFVANVEFQMVLGKGQVEIDIWNFSEHVKSCIILIEGVEKLNHHIYVASDKRIKEMTRTAIVHRDIREIEWRFLVVEMATRDLKKLRHDVTKFTPTRKLLAVIQSDINLDNMYNERIALAENLRAVYIRYQNIYIRAKKRLLKLYQVQTKRQHETNEEYKGDIFAQAEELVARQANKLLPGLNVSSKTGNEQRAVQLMLRGYLQRKIIRLCNEMERLEEELERQYKRTYPIL